MGNRLAAVLFPIQMNFCKCPRRNEPSFYLKMQTVPSVITKYICFQERTD